MHRNRPAQPPKAARLPALTVVCFLAFSLSSPLSAEQHSALIESHHYLRRYQATAYISLLSVSLFSRSGVGFGYVKADDDVFPDHHDISLQFLAGSFPERAHGLNRFGFIQENIKERDKLFAEASYFGLITANAEESISQAKAALETNSQTTPFVAAQAFLDRQIARYSIRHLALSSAYRGANAEALLGQVHASFDRPEMGQSEHRQFLNGELMGTFLYSLHQAMIVPTEKSQERFIYNGKIFRLLTEKHADEKVGQELHNEGVIRQPSSTTRLNGAIHNEKTKEVTNFKLWFDPTSTDLLPLRFEFRPKSFLRLVFQATSAKSNPGDTSSTSKSAGTLNP